MAGIGDLVRRRWKASAVVFLLCVLATIGAGLTASPTQSFSSTILLIPPKVIAKAEPGTVDYTRGNPLFYLGALDQSRDILIGSLTSQSEQMALAERYPGVAVTASRDVLGSGPVIVVEGTGKSPEQVTAAVQYRVRTVPDLLRKMQQGLGISADAMITSSVITEDRATTINRKPQIRTGIVAGGAVGVLGMLLVALVDIVSESRSGRRRSVRTTSSAAATATPDNAPDATTEAPAATVPEATPDTASAAAAGHHPPVVDEVPNSIGRRDAGSTPRRRRSFESVGVGDRGEGGNDVGR